MNDQSSWKWFGHAGHLIVANQCRFHLCTQVGNVLVSTVGDYYSRGVRTTLGGSDEFYETYVFNVLPGPACMDIDCGCGLPIVDWQEIDACRCATAGQAMHTHMMLCSKYQQEQVNPAPSQDIRAPAH